jgi:hypothetical protein
MNEIQFKGATAEEWFHFDMELGLAAHLLPCVPASPGVVVSAGSALEGKVGKIPSQFNQHGEAHGLKGWQKREITLDEIGMWSRDRRLNLCVRTGVSGVHAIDVDISDDTLAFEIGNFLAAVFDTLGVRMYARSRSNSTKFLIPFILEGAPCKKAIIRTDHGIIELLGDGQQFVAAGSHSSGVRYEWTPSLPSALPSISRETLTKIWTDLTQIYAKAGTSTTDPIATATAETTTPDQALMTTTDAQTETDLISALNYLAPLSGDNTVWSEVGYALLTLNQKGLALWREFSQKAPNYEKDAADTWWQTHQTSRTRTDYRHVFSMAISRGWNKSRTSAAGDFTPVEDVPAGDTDAGGEPETLVLPILRLIPGALAGNVKEISRHLQGTVYNQGTVQVRLSQDALDDGIRRDPNSLKLLQITPGWLRVRIGGSMQVVKPVRGGAFTPADVPAEYVSAFMDMTENPNLRNLRAIQRSPYVRLDGTINDTEGYDEQSGVIYVPNTDYPPVPSNPTKADALKALDELLAPFAEFPFASAASRSAFAAHVLTEAARVALDTVPMFFYSAPDAGTGKTLLSVMPSLIVHGFEPAVRPWLSDGDETRKTLFASLMAGDRSVAFDNLPTGYKVRSPELCAFITSVIWKDRKLGVSETYALTNTAVVSASGNNINPVGDMARRSLIVRLDANSDRLRERRFSISDLRWHVMEHRPQMLVNALTIIRAHQLSPLQDAPIDLPSFNRWSRLVRNALVWLGMEDPVVTQKEEADDESGNINFIFSALLRHFGDREFNAVDVARLAGSLSDTDEALKNVLVSSGCKNPNDPGMIGYWVRASRGRIGAGMKLVPAGRNTQGSKWKFIQADSGDLV